MKIVRLLVVLASGLAAGANQASGTETEHLGMQILPVPSKVVIDGRADDWDLTGGIFVCGDVENQRDRFAVWFHAMYDGDGVYLLARWIDETPLNNPGQVAGSYGFAGDCLQVRILTAPGGAKERGNHFTCWRDRDGKDVIFVELGRDFQGGTLKDAKAHHARQALRLSARPRTPSPHATRGGAQSLADTRSGRKNTDAKGYVQEIALPWKLLTRDGSALKAGESLVITVEPNFTVGGQGRLSIKDIFQPGITPDRVFTFRSYRCWGTGTLERKGRLTPRPVRLSDAREFPVRMEGARPVIDWTGLVRSDEPKGFKPIRFTLPEDGYVSIHIRGAAGEVVRQLLSAAFLRKGSREVKWDGLTTRNWRTPGDPVPPGVYTWRGIWHGGVGLRLRGWAANGGSAPWGSGPTSNWGGDHGVPVACAAAAGRVLLGWSGAEAGDALLACDAEGKVLWKNSRKGMAGAEFVAADGPFVYAANWGPEHSNTVYRLRAETGSYAAWPNGSPDLFLKDVLPDARTAPNRIDGLAAGGGKLYLSLASARFRREHVTDWRGLLGKLKAGEGLAGRIWEKLEAGRRRQAEKWLAGSAPEDEGLKAPNYYTPDVRDAVIRVLNDLLADKALTAHAVDLSPGALAAANRSHVEGTFRKEIVRLRTGVVAVVDAKAPKLLHAWPVANPGLLCAAGERCVYVVSDGAKVVALDPTTGKTRTAIAGLHNATGVAVDSAGRIYVAVGGPDNQVKVFRDVPGKETPADKPAAAIGRKGGRRLLGPWQADGMAFAKGIAVDARGRLWVAEADMHPKRISVWDTKTGRFVKEFFGPTTYGALGGAISPLDANVMVGQGCEWRIDPRTGRAACVGCITRDGMSNSRFGVGAGARLSARPGTVRSHAPRGERSTPQALSRAKLYLAVAPGWIHGSGDIRIFERVGPADYKLRSMFLYEGKGKTARTRFWADANGDGRQQDGEIASVDGHVRFSGWYMSFAPDMTIYSGDRKFQVAGFTKCGAPRYDLARPVKMPAAGFGSADGTRVLQAGAYGKANTWFHCFDIASGRKLWSYPDNFVGVHGSHRACPPAVGMIRGSFGPCGTAAMGGAVGDVWVIPTNVGEWHVLTAEGFYLTGLFQGDPMKVAWPPEAAVGAVMDNCPPGLGGEDFGGSVCFARDGKLYLQAGKTGFWNLAVVGLDTVRAMKGGQVTLSAADVKKAEKLRTQYLQKAVGVRKLALVKRTVAFTGDLNRDFAGVQIVTYKKQDSAAVRSAAAWDAGKLYLAWDVRDKTPWLNAANVPEQMYVRGDTVDFQIGTDARADRKRSEAARGDLRLSIGNFRGKPTAVLYRKVSDEKKPKSFSSGVIRDYRMEYVAVVPDATIKVTLRRGRGYLVEAAVPLAALGLRPRGALTLPGDFGVTHGGPDGRRTRLRTYWNNQNTGIVDDVVFELKMEPKNWGDLIFKE